MISLRGIYRDGLITLEKNPAMDHPVDVIVTFLEESVRNTESRESAFSFQESKHLLKNLGDSLSDTIIQERRSEL